MPESSIVYIIDDDQPVRDSIGMLLETVGLAHRGYADAQSFLDDYSSELHGCLVLDVRMPGMSGLDLQRRLKDLGSTLPIVFITGHGDIPMAVDAMRSGAIDFIRKPFREEELLDRVREALDVDARLSRDQLLTDAAHEKFERLTAREKEVFERVAAGQANKVIAIELEISERTVEIHRSHVMQKTESRTLADLVRLKFALE